MHFAIHDVPYAYHMAKCREDQGYRIAEDAKEAPWQTRSATHYEERYEWAKHGEGRTAKTRFPTSVRCTQAVAASTHMRSFIA